MWPAFRHHRLEEAYRRHTASHQVHADLIYSFFGALFGTVITRWALEASAYKAAASGVLGLGLCVSLHCFIRLNRRDYPAMRNLLLPPFYAALLYNWLQLGSVQNERHTSQNWALPLLVFVRLHFLPMFLNNLTVRLPMPLHILTYGFGPVLYSKYNAANCRWALSSLPMPWLGKLAAGMRRLAQVPAPPPGSFRASPEGACAVAVTFFQTTVGCLLPSAIVLLLELRSRREFLKELERDGQGEHQQQEGEEQQRQQEEPLQEGGSLQLAEALDAPELQDTGHWEPDLLLRWQVAAWLPLELLGCWWAAEGAAVYFGP